MAIATFRMNIPAAAWTLVADGATVGMFGVQVSDGLPVKIALAAASPAVDSDAFIIVGGDNERSFALTLDTGTKVYAQAVSSAVQIRGYKN